MVKKKRVNKTTRKVAASRQGGKRAKEKNTTALVVSRQRAPVRVSVDALALIPEEEVWGIHLKRDSWNTTVVAQKRPECPALEGHGLRCLKPSWHMVSRLKWIPEVWLASRKSARTRRAYQNDVAQFMKTFGITSPAELRKVDHRAVMAWERLMREQEGIQHTTVRRRLAALSSLFIHLVKFGVVEMNPVRDVERPVVNRREGMTLAFSQKQARAILDKPREDTVLGLRDRAILSVGLQVGFRRSEVAGLKVGDLHENRGFDSLRVVRKGGKKGSLAINPQTAQRIKDYFAVAGHGEDLDGPLFRPVRGNKEGQDSRRHLHPDIIDRVLRKYARHIRVVP